MWYNLKRIEELIYDLKNDRQLYEKFLVIIWRTENIEDKVTKITFLTKGESKHLSVAAASVISRYRFLQEMDKLSEKYKVDIPKGASPKVDSVAKKILDSYGKNELSKIVKLNFKNTEKILNN